MGWGAMALKKEDLRKKVKRKNQNQKKKGNKL